MRSLSASESVMPIVQVLLPLMAAVAGWAGWRALGYRRLPHSLHISARLITWVPALLGAVVVTGLLIVGDRSDVGLFAPGRIIEGLVPLIAGMQAAFLFSPEDEPGLEVLLACPRPLAWTVVERLALLLAGQGLVALLGGLAASALLPASFLAGVAGWLPPLLLLPAIALVVTVSTRQPLFSVALTLLLWFGMVSNAGVGGGLLTRWPFLWPLHVYLQPGHAHYWLNRASLFLASLNLIVLAAAYLLRDEERVLLGTRPVAAPRKAGGDS
jgi:hypothetical protein